MNINLYNYEAYFLDYVEGKLNAAQIAELMAFIAKNPGLKDELENYEAITIEPSYNVFANKNKLKKDISDILKINSENFDEFCIARIEGDLDKNTELLFEKYLQQNPEKLREYKQYLKTLLEPDKSIVFEEKRRLKHFVITRRKTSLTITIAAAASITLFIIIYKFMYNVGIQKIEVATNLPEKDTTTTILTSELVIKTEKNEKKQTEILQKEESKIEPLHNELKDKKDTIVPLMPQLRKEIYELKPSDLLSRPALAAIQIPQVVVPEIEITEINDKYLTINELATTEVKKVIDKQNIVNEDGINLWALAKSGIKQVNRLTGANLTLEKTKDTTSNRTIVKFNTDLLSFYSSSEK
jgi:hypothetical protein